MVAIGQPDTGLVAFIREKMFQRGEEERPEAAARTVGGAEMVFCEQAREEFLREILGVVRAVSLPADESEDGLPASAAGFFQGVACLGGIRGSRRPARRSSGGARTRHWTAAKRSWTSRTAWRRFRMDAA